MIEKAALPERARQNAIGRVPAAGRGRGAVHQVPIENVHFHEVGAADSIADIVGACVAFDLLGVDRHRLLAAECGQRHGEDRARHAAGARSGHGGLLTASPIYARGPGRGIDHAYRRRVAVTLGTRFGVLPPMKIARMGYGAGGHDFPEQANVLRVILGEATRRAEATTISVIEANIDDLSPQVLAYAMERLLEAGALDVTLQPIADEEEPARQPAARDRQAGRSRSAGADRSSPRPPRWACASIPPSGACRRAPGWRWKPRYGNVRMKVSGEGAYAPEYEDCRKLAQRSGVALQAIIARSQLRVPEQIQMKILSHHSHLLRECRAAHRPCLHHHRGRPDQALQTHAGL